MIDAALQRSLFWGRDQTAPTHRQPFKPLQPLQSQRRKLPCKVLAQNAPGVGKESNQKPRMLPIARAASSSMLDGGAPSKVQQQQQPPKSPSATWLSQYPPYSDIPASAVAYLARGLSVQRVKQGDTITVAGEGAEAMWVVVDGSVVVEGDDSSMASSVCVFSGRHPVKPGATIGPGSTLNLQESLLGQAAHVTTRAKTDVLLWRSPAVQVQRAVLRYPQIGLQLSRIISERLEWITDVVQDKEARSKALQPYRMPGPRRGIIGNSKYAKRLRQQVVTASRDKSRGPVLVYGEPGLDKDSYAALVHVGSKDYNMPIVKVDCDRYAGSSGLSLELEVFGGGAKRGLLYWLQDGTLVLNNVHMLPPNVLPRLVDLVKRSGNKKPATAAAAAQDSTQQQQQGSGKVLDNEQEGMASSSSSSSPSSSSSEPLQQPGGDGDEVRGPRILMIAERTVPQLEGIGVMVIKVPPLRVRPSDISSLVAYFLAKAGKRSGAMGRGSGQGDEGQPPMITQEVLQKLESYPFPGNVRELEAAIERALVQTKDQEGQQGGGGQLSPDVFWFASQDTNRYRLNLLKTFPWLRTNVRSEFWPRTFNTHIVAPVYALVVALLFLGPQDRAHNFALNLFWDWWWPLIFVAYPFLGRIWCSFCPFMIYGGFVQQIRLKMGAKLKKWPRESIQVWGGWFLFSLFYAILVWEECWDLNNTAYLSSWLLLLITAGAVVCSALFERRLWCRYLCPIGGMNALFAKMSITELRARQGVCSSECSTYGCYKGGPEAPPEGLETNGCPLYSHPAQLEDNRHCVLCMECVKACPHRSVQINLRPPGADIWQNHQGDWPELCLMFMLQGAVYLHCLPQLAAQLGIADISPLTDDLTTHMLVSAAVLAAPGVLCWAADDLAQRAARAGGYGSGGGGGGSGALLAMLAPGFMDVAYGWVPMVWACTLAFYLEALMGEAGQLLPVAARTFGLEGGWLPVVAAQPPVISFVQVAVLVIGAGISILTTFRLGKRITPRVLTQWGLIGLTTLEMWHLMVREDWNLPLFGSSPLL